MSSGVKGSRTCLLIAVCLLGLLAASPLALARTDRADDDSYSGSCHFSGTLLFDPPLKTDFQPVHTAASASGTCDGTFTTERGRARDLSGELVRYYVDANGQIACGPGGENVGTGFLQFGRERLYFSFSEVREVGSATLNLTGFHSGTAAGQGSVSAEEDPVQLATSCANEGLSQVRITIDVATTPSISG